MMISLCPPPPPTHHFSVLLQKRHPVQINPGNYPTSTPLLTEVALQEVCNQPITVLPPCGMNGGWGIRPLPKLYCSEVDTAFSLDKAFFGLLGQFSKHFMISGPNLLETKMLGLSGKILSPGNQDAWIVWKDSISWKPRCLDCLERFSMLPDRAEMNI